MERPVNIATLGTNTQRNYFSGSYINKNKAIAEDVIAYATEQELGFCFIQGATPEMERIFDATGKFVFAGNYRCDGKINELGSKLLTFISSLEEKKEFLKNILTGNDTKSLAKWGNESAGILIQKEMNPKISKTTDLPSKGIQRHYTEALIDFNGLPTILMGSHLTHDNKDMRMTQLNIFLAKAEEHIKKEMPVIVSGLFNINKGDSDEYLYLKEEIDRIGLQEVPVTENTYVAYDKQGNITNNSGIKSYIFCSKEFTLNNSKVAEENSSFKHQPVSTTLYLSDCGLKKLEEYEKNNYEMYHWSWVHNQKSSDREEEIHQKRYK